MQRPSVVADEHVGRAATVGSSGAEVERRAAVRPVHALGRYCVRDHVDETADRVRAVQERRRTAHDFDLRRAGRVHGDAVVPRLARHVTHALPVLEDEHAIAVEAANDRPRRAGTERALGHSRLSRQRRADRRPELLGQVLPGKHGRGLIGIERISRIGADRHHFAVVQLGIDRDVERHRSLRDGQLRPRGDEALGDHQQVVRAGGHVGDRCRSRRPPTSPRASCLRSRRSRRRSAWTKRNDKDGRKRKRPERPRSLPARAR